MERHLKFCGCPDGFESLGLHHGKKRHHRFHLAGCRGQFRLERNTAYRFGRHARRRPFRGMRLDANGRGSPCSTHRLHRRSCAGN